MRTRSVGFTATLLLWGAGCVGTFQGPTEGKAEATPPPGSMAPDGTTPPKTDPTGAPGPAAPPATIPSSGGSGGVCQESAPQVSAARRLTREQYANTIRDLLGDKRALADKLPIDDSSDGLFVAPSTLIVTPTWAGNAMAAAEDIAKAAVTNLATLVPCPPTDGESCAKTFIANFGKRTFRRPLLPAESTGLLEVFRAGNGNGGFTHGIELVVQAALQSPSFLYRFELGQKDGSSAGAVKLSQYEIASRLSYGIVGTMPDEALMKAADAGELTTPDEIATHARRLVNDERARATLVDFTARWFGLDHLDEVMKDPEQYPQFNEKLLTSMKTGVHDFVDDLLKGDGRFQTLLTGAYAFVDAGTAPLYGVTAAGATTTKVDLPGGKRFGLLTDVGILTAHTFADPSAPIHRGKFIRERLFCTDPPNPPADLMVEPPTPRPGVSTRERLKEHTDVDACRGCHEYMDPIGFAFGNFDGLGRWRDMDGGKPVDAKGTLQFTDVDGDFNGVGELVERLTRSGKLEECVAGTFLRFVSGTESAIDDCAQKKLRAAFSEAKGDLRELVVAITRTDAFRYRRLISGEVLQ
jgi:Protein of unknown function (DUF1592)/Protein of unknown function (DUF1588)/Protein of unknown function (DUF1595)/Protein of unknown function (DUF1587)/Protein of unknown function (DUF1585)